MPPFGDENIEIVRSPLPSQGPPGLCAALDPETDSPCTCRGDAGHGAQAAAGDPPE